MDIFLLERLLKSILFKTLLILSLTLIIPGYCLAARSVALVYDDSGSMLNQDRWLYANYALQALTAFLGNNDTFYLVAMSEYDHEQMFSGLEAKHSLIDQLKHAKKPLNGSGTYYQAVQKALQLLINSDANNEKWLVVITDGEFFDKNQMKNSDFINQIEQESIDFVQNTGSRSVLLLIGASGDQTIANIWHRSGQATILKAANSSEIVEQLHETAAMLTSRNKLPADLHPVINNNNLIVSPRFPLKHLTIFVQRRDAKKAPPTITKVSIEGLDGDYDSYPLSMVNVSSTKEQSRANVIHIAPHNQDGLIQPGKDRLNLTFDQMINDFGFRLYPEVAARLEVAVYDAQEHLINIQPNTSIEVCENSPISIHAKLLTEDGKSLSENDPDIDQFHVNLYVDDNDGNKMTPNTQKTEFIGKLNPNSGVSKFSVSAAYPGYFNYLSRIYTFRAIDCKPRNLSIEADTSLWKESIDALPMNKVNLSVKVDNHAIDANTFNSATMKITSSSELIFDLVKDESTKQWVLSSSLKWGCACFTPTGQQKIDLLLSTAKAEEQVSKSILLNVNDIPLWKKCGLIFLNGLLIVLLLLYLYGLYKKPRFRLGSIVTYKRGGRSQTEHLPNSWFIRWLIPFVPERRYVGSVLFIAGSSSSYIFLSRKTQSDKMTIGGLPLDNPGNKDIRLSNTETLEIPSRQLESYTYSSIS